MAPTTRSEYENAAVELAKRDRVVADLIDLVGLPKIAAPKLTHFAALARSVLYQQLAGSAASAIHGRLVDALGGEVTPQAFLALPFERLREVGLSNNKALSLCDLAQKVVDGHLLLDSRRLARQDDEAIVSALSTVRGIGRWTAQMFLMFQLRRLDVWPSGDLGVRRGFSLAWGVDMPTERELEPLGEAFVPYRSVVAWYCWRSCEVYANRIIADPIAT